MLRNRRLSLLLAICVTIFGLSRIAAQDATPISPPTETSVPTLPPTEIPTDVPSATPLPTLTLTPTPLPTETPTLLPTPTASHTATETPTEAPTLQASASPTETLTAEPSLISEMSPTATSTDASKDQLPTATPQIALVTGTPVAEDTTPRMERAAVLSASVSALAATNLTAADVSQLRTQISNANSDCSAGQSYIIDLTGASPYTITNSVEYFFGDNGLPVIRCKITINGNGKVIQRSSTNRFRIFAVDQMGNLTLDNLTVAGGSASEVGGSGVFVFKGIVTIRNNSFIINNTLDFTSGAEIIGAGIYTYYGQTSIDHTTISNNTNNTAVGDGGGIGINGAINANSISLSMDAVTLSSNKASRLGGGIFYTFARSSLVSHSDIRNNLFSPGANPQGGAVYAFSSPVTVAYSCIVDNDNIDFYSGGAVAFGNNNWWGVSTGPDENSSFNVLTAPYTTSLPSNCTNPSVAERLAEFGITTSGWTLAQLQMILDAVTITAQALAAQSTGNDLPQDAFKRVMGTTLTIDRSNLNPVKPICVTTPNISKIQCDPTNQTTVFTIVHELGHMFSYRSGGSDPNNRNSLYNLLRTAGSVKNNSVRPDKQYVIFGTFLRREDRKESDNWWRGTDGWGSAAVQPWSCDGINTSPPFPFQQNPCDVPIVVDLVEVEEASADFFLNWVYLKVNAGGFANKLWTNNGPQACYSNGCNDNGRLSGNARMTWMDDPALDNNGVPIGAIPHIFSSLSWNS